MRMTVGSSTSLAPRHMTIIFEAASLNDRSRLFILDQTLSVLWTLVVTSPFVRARVTIVTTVPSRRRRIRDRRLDIPGFSMGA